MKNIVVDFSKLGFKYNNCARNNNWCDDFHFPESYPADLDLLNKEDIGGGKFRIWLKLDEIYDDESGEYNFERYYRYIQTASARNEELLLNFGIDVNRDIKIWTKALTNILVHYKERFSNIIYVECLNEPDLVNIDVDTYYRWYKCFYEAVSAVNERIYGSRLLLGGPVLALFESNYLDGFLLRYSEDTSTKKLLDFVSVHDYAGDNDGDGPIRYEHMNRIYKIRSRVNDMLLKYSLSKELPLFITELGVFPGDRATDNFEEDMYAQSAGCAVITAMYGSTGENNHLFHWSVRHKTNPRKNVLAEGKLNELTAYGRLLKILAPMKGRVAKTNPGLADYKNGPGVFATADDEALWILLWNYNYVNYSRSDEVVELTVKGIEFGDSNVRMNTENLDGEKETMVFAPASVIKKTFNMPRNSVVVIRLVRDNIKFFNKPNTTQTEVITTSIKSKLNKGNAWCLPEIRKVKKVTFRECTDEAVTIERSFDGMFWENVYEGKPVRGELEISKAVSAVYIREKNGKSIKCLSSEPLKWLLGCAENQNSYNIRGCELTLPAILDGSRANLIMSVGENNEPFTVSVHIGEDTAEDAVLKLSLYDEIRGWREYTAIGVTKESGELNFDIYDSFAKCVKLESYSKVQINKISF